MNNRYIHWAAQVCFYVPTIIMHANYHETSSHTVPTVEVSWFYFSAIWNNRSSSSRSSRNLDSRGTTSVDESPIKSSLYNEHLIIANLFLFSKGYVITRVYSNRSLLWLWPQNKDAESLESSDLFYMFVPEEALLEWSISTIKISI